MFVNEDGTYMLTSYGIVDKERLVTEVETLIAS